MEVFKTQSETTRAFYFQVPFSLQFTYQYAHQIRKHASATGFFNCDIDAHHQLITFQMDLQSDVIARPFSYKSSLFCKRTYQALSHQRIVIDNQVVRTIKYRTPIVYNWHLYLCNEAKKTYSLGTLERVMKRYVLKDEQQQPILLFPKVIHLQADW
ncbi:hypothetical protein ACFSTH_07350 [Paenibacillus yanchengensis]|uniref:Uncharacterized protein n=1 Tax=Paenibacillus yanchengensis TaxID=2035833 RepID=A0ABW4YM48_9BACL